MTPINRMLQERPLLSVLLLGALVRVIAAVCSRGFLAFDDHHVLVDAADRLASGEGLDIWHQRSVLYSGTVALIMRATQLVDDPSPATQLLVVRLVQAAFSLLGVPATVIDGDGAPRAERTVALWNPELLDEELGLRASALSEASMLMAGLVERGLRTLCFATSRKGP